jgi:exodeoxyribonuclease VII small subunit
MVRVMAEKKFENALKELEQIVEQLEDSELPLDDALKLFERGIKLSQFCSAKLDDAEQKVELLIKGANGALSPIPFEETDGET